MATGAKIVIQTVCSSKANYALESTTDHMHETACLQTIPRWGTLDNQCSPFLIQDLPWQTCPEHRCLLGHVVKYPHGVSLVGHIAFGAFYACSTRTEQRDVQKKRRLCSFADSVSSRFLWEYFLKLSWRTTCVIVMRMQCVHDHRVMCWRWGWSCHVLTLRLVVSCADVEAGVQMNVLTGTSFSLPFGNDELVDPRSPAPNLARTPVPQLGNQHQLPAALLNCRSPTVGLTRTPVPMLGAFDGLRCIVFGLVQGIPFWGPRCNPQLTVEAVHTGSVRMYYCSKCACVSVHNAMWVLCVSYHCS